MEIKVLGSGCSRCKTAHEIVKSVVAESGIDATVEYVDDIMQVINYNVMSTPAVVVDGEVRLSGRVPSRGEVKTLLGL